MTGLAAVRAARRPAARPRLVIVALIAVLLVAAAATLTLGRLGIPLADLPSALLTGSTGKTAFVLERLRGPRLLAAAGVGAALGLAGALFQTVTRNPLGSPDMVGLASGAGAGVALCTLFAPAVPPSVGAVAGGAVALGIVWIATGRGFASPGRVLVAGIGVTAMAAAVTQYAVSVALRDQGSQLAAYLVGSLNSTGVADVAVIALTLAVVVPAAAVLRHRIAVLELGDDVADALGAAAARTRTGAIVVSLVAASGAVAVAGPIAFVALTAPPIARMLTRRSGAELTVSALAGALVLVLADLAVQQVSVLSGLPVGVLTAAVGGGYLGVLLVSRLRRGRL
ncbi:iron chelate uptake ABC transporter family permease subunit [Leifsonia sp. NPDC058194]|uniref:iron chelate uptake ABC transporter family permease subunit n=1 Tax=Leifsonia sp. NPDC058194 TaxID=3346374 RepID=UPI0036DBA4C6